MRVLIFLLCFLGSSGFTVGPFHFKFASFPFQTAISNEKCTRTLATPSTLEEPQIGVDRAQKLKDLTFLKEVKNNILTAELALQVDVRSKKVGGINYEGLAGKLEKDLEILERRAHTINQLYNSTEVVEGLVAKLTEYQQGLEEIILKEEAKSKDATQVGKKKKAKKEEPSESDSDSSGGIKNPLQLFVREDGSVDVELLVESGKEAAEFGNDLWNRINGRQPGEEEAEKKLAKIPDSPVIIEMAKYVATLKEELAEARKNENSLALTYRTLKREGGVVTKDMRGNLRAAEDVSLELSRMIQILELDIEMERVLPYIELEIEQSISTSNDQKLTVAQYALVENQLKALVPAAQKRDADFLLEAVDDSDIRVLYRDIEDIKTRLGLDLLEEGSSISIKLDAVSIQSYINKSLVTIKEGLTFYTDGTKILSSDVSYAFGLVARAAQGYTLSPREVRSVRRTGKDMLTFIPFLIILIAPLSPVGHVLVFSFIQRYFPDFFPTPYTDRRQNLLKMYELIEEKDTEKVDGGVMAMPKQFLQSFLPSKKSKDQD